MTLLLRIAFVFTLLALLISCNRQQPGYSLSPVPFYQVDIDDAFWSPRLDTNRDVTIPHAFRRWEDSGIMDNFAIAGGLMAGSQCGNYPFDDSDVYKTIEGAAYSLRTHPDVPLAQYLDTLIAQIGAAQESDGYLYTARTNRAERLVDWSGETRWSKLERSHELYNAGHLYEAAVAHYQTTGRRTLLDIALKNADLIVNTFGPNKRQTPPGHQEIEIGLVKLFQLTGKRDYLDLARFFLEARGEARDGRTLWKEYAQDHLPVLHQTEAVGHAVRAPYMYAAMMDVGALTGETRFIAATDRLWENVVGKKLHLTGGLGSVSMGESLGGNYELPNMTAYNETCASIANMLWQQRMFLMHREAGYVDVLERTLYNAFLAGVSMSGNRFFYDNPLASRGQHERTPHFYCNCCLGNVSRFMASLPGMIYAQDDSSVYVNLFIGSRVTIRGEHPLTLLQQTGYPFDGRVQIDVEPEEQQSLSIFVRLPGWARQQPVPGDLYTFGDSSAVQPTLLVNGEPAEIVLQNGYIRIQRSWWKGDRIELQLPMEVQQVVAHRNVAENEGRFALQRGPLVYCLEGPDQADGQVHHLQVSPAQSFRAAFRPELLNGLGVIEGKASKIRLGENNHGYRFSEQPLVAIPYYAWAHRGRSEMTVWLPTRPELTRPQNAPEIAQTSRISSSGGGQLAALADSRAPRSAASQAVAAFYWTPRQDTAWVQYDFQRPEEVSQVQVYWMNSGGEVNCRYPLSWRILANINGEWRPVWNPERTWKIERDGFSQAYFETVKTDALRLEAIADSAAVAGIGEWRVY